MKSITELINNFQYTLKLKFLQKIIIDWNVEYLQDFLKLSSKNLVFITMV